MYGQTIYGLSISVCTGYNEQSVSIKSSLFYFCIICSKEIIKLLYNHMFNPFLLRFGDGLLC